jgi:hypothetical protein
MESTARPTHQIDRKNIFMANAWKCQRLATNTNSRMKKEINRVNRVIVEAWNRHLFLRHNWLEIVSEKIVHIDFEIATEIWVTADVWNRQHDLCIKSKPKIDSWLTHGIVNHTPNADPEIISENWVTIEREIIFENWVTADWWNRHRILIHD